MKAGWFVAAVGIGCLWLALGRGTEAEPRVADGATRHVEELERVAAAPEGPESARRAVTAAPSSSAVAPHAAASTASTAPGKGSLEVSVRYESDRTTASDVGVYVRPRDGRALGLERRTDANGRVRFAALDLGAWQVHVDRAALPVNVALTGEERLEILIPTGLEVQGRVLDLAGAGVPGASVFRYNPAHHDLMQQVATADAEGRFSLRDIGANEQFLARASGFQPSELERPGANEGAGLELVMGARGHRLRGRVIDAEGAPVPAAWVGIGVDEDAREELTGSTRAPGGRRKPLDRECLFVRADERGAFDTDEVPAGHTLVLARPPLPAADERAASLGAIAVHELWVGPGEVPELTLQLEAGARITGVVRNEHGRPVPGLEVVAEWEGTLVLGQMEDDLGPWISDRRATTGEDGGFALTGMLVGDYDLDVLGAGGSSLASAEREVARASRTEWNPVVEGGDTLQLRVLGPGGRPVVGWGVVARAGGSLYAEEQSGRRTDEDGGSTIEFLDPGSAYEVGFYPPRPDGSLPDMPAARRSGVVAGGGLREFHLTPGELPTAGLSGQWVDEAGAPVASAELELERLDGPGWSSTITGKDGSFAFAQLPAGQFMLLAGRSPYPRGVSLATVDLAPEEQRDVGRLTVGGTSHLVVTLTSEGAADERRAGFALEPLQAGAAGAGEQRVRWEQVGAVWTSTPVEPGSYLLRVTGEPCGPALCTVQVGSADVHLTLDRETGTQVRMEVLLRPSRERLAELSMRVFDSADVLVVDNQIISSGAGDDDPSVELSVRLFPGTYRVEVTHFGGVEVAGELELQVGAEDEPGRPLPRLDLR